MATGAWTDDEIQRTVDVYFQMLTLELAGESYTKAEFRRDAERDVHRSPAAIEYKFSNVSAVLDELGAVWIPGYKPLRSIQGRLRDFVVQGFQADAELRTFMLRSVSDPNVASATSGPGRSRRSWTGQNEHGRGPGQWAPTSQQSNRPIERWVLPAS